MARDLIAKRKVYYAKREYAQGDHFVAENDRDAEALVLVGAADRVTETAASASPEPAPPRRGPGRPRKIETAEPHTYGRRDLVAED